MSRTTNRKRKPKLLIKKPDGSTTVVDVRPNWSPGQELCVKCGKNPRYTRNGRVLKLCASCGWKNIVGFVNEPDPVHPQPPDGGQREQG